MADNAIKFAVHPGEYLREVLDAYQMTQSELAERLGISQKHLSHIITGKVRLTPDVAQGLEMVFPTRKASLWNTMQSNYDEVESRSKVESQLLVHEKWVELFPYNELVKRGAVPRARGTVDRGIHLLEFFQVASVDAWKGVYPHELDIACRGVVDVKRRELDHSSAALASWIRLGQIRFVKERVNVRSFSSDLLADLVPTVKRACLVTDMDELLESVRLSLLDAGVVLLFEHALQRMKTYGYSHKPTSGSPALIQLCARMKYHDQLCFTLLHEIGHLLHGADENQADSFAAGVLIDPTAYSEFVGAKTFNPTSIKVFASGQGVNPGIVTARLQREGLIPFSAHNDLRHRYADRT